MTLAWYEDYFALFGDLEGFVQFFLLEDLLAPDRSAARFFLPFDDFTRPTSTPANVDEYKAYVSASTDFVRARNQRIDAWVADTAEGP